ncbi:hypothetical protein [Lentibacillus cibarius]|uniref:DUF3221 domain-containing protein n=1 Tax=Lentibacillus cibarius TaxID=2583219 RepID=A0A5S3QNH6_9BACI|nr:hypothetical protein [Lentibacillus cibarius]TMN22056.1 hypothetical protein FFL34_07910 [Lentibacillus cibarius]
MKKGLLFLFLALSITLIACGQEEDIDTLDKHKGTIVSIEKKNEDSDSFEGWYFMLVISDVKDVNISKKDDDELKELAKEKDGAYYNVPPTIYKSSDLKVGNQVVAYFDKESQAESNPPVRDAEKIDE